MDTLSVKISPLVFKSIFILGELAKEFRPLAKRLPESELLMEILGDPHAKQSINFTSPNWIGESFVHLFRENGEVNRGEARIFLNERECVTTLFYIDTTDGGVKFTYHD